LFGSITLQFAHCSSSRGPGFELLRMHPAISIDLLHHSQDHCTFHDTITSASTYKVAVGVFVLTYRQTRNDHSDTTGIQICATKHFWR